MCILPLRILALLLRTYCRNKRYFSVPYAVTPKTVRTLSKICPFRGTLEINTKISDTGSSSLREAVHRSVKLSIIGSTNKSPFAKKKRIDAIFAQIIRILSSETEFKQRPNSFWSNRTETIKSATRLFLRFFYKHPCTAQPLIRVEINYYHIVETRGIVSERYQPGLISDTFLPSQTSATYGHDNVYHDEKNRADYYINFNVFPKQRPRQIPASFPERNGVGG